MVTDLMTSLLPFAVTILNKQKLFATLNSTKNKVASTMPRENLSSYIKYTTKNKNLDICVSDCDAHAVVVVNQIKNSSVITLFVQMFTITPTGITIDSQNRILTAASDRILYPHHTLERQFIRLIENCLLLSP